MEDEWLSEKQQVTNDLLYDIYISIAYDIWYLFMMGLSLVKISNLNFKSKLKFQIENLTSTFMNIQFLDLWIKRCILSLRSLPTTCLKEDFVWFNSSLRNLINLLIAMS